MVRHCWSRHARPGFSCKDTELTATHTAAPVSASHRFSGRQTRQLLALVALGCVGLLAFGLYLQHVVGLEPCPMCIVQRYALVLVAVVSGVAAFIPGSRARLWAVGLLGALAGFGAFVAARQSWLQWNPPEILSCGRDFFGMIESFPLKRAIPMIFRGTGDCSTIDWTFLGLSIANWSFLCFSAIALLAGLLILRRPAH
jgi:protein dithiol:quinone oxidoreductase